MRKTPRTDAVWEKFETDLFTLACELEDELNNALEKINRLEKAGDEAIYPLEYAARVRIWTEAKEANP